MSQRDLAARLGAGRRTVQDWETGIGHPGAERLQAVIHVLLESGGLTVGGEAAEAQQMWAAVLREARMRTPFDEAWFASLLAAHNAPGQASDQAREVASDVTGRMAAASVDECDQDWGTAPDVRGFVGRAEELGRLRDWVLEAGCRLVAVLGMGGVGKTSLAAKLAADAAESFHAVYWRSLRDAPPVSEWLADAIGFLSGQRVVPPEGEGEQLRALLHLLRERPSLLVMDNFETLLEPGDSEVRYRQGYEGYGRMLRTVAEGRHHSCVLLTSREAPEELAVLGGAARTLHLGGLLVDDAQMLLAPKQLVGTDAHWTELNARFGGNGLALNVVGEGIRELFGGDLGSFLAEDCPGSIFGSIRRLLDEQIQRSSSAEQQVLRVLAVEREPLTVGGLVSALGPRLGRADVLDAVDALRRRSLVERTETPGTAAFTLQSVLLEHMTDRLVEDAADEIARGKPHVIVEQVLIKAQAKDYVRHTQERLIGAPILQQLKAQHGERGTERLLLGLLDNWRDRRPAEQGYGPGNIINLTRLMRGDLRGLDLSRLAIRQAYVAGVQAQDTSLAGADLAESVLADAFDFPGSVALSADGAVLATGTSTGQVWLWRVADRTLVMVLEGHRGAVWGLALSADGQVVASGGAGGIVRVSNASTGEALAVLHGHTGAVWAAGTCADGHVVASGGQDGTVRVWDGDRHWGAKVLQGHIGGVRAVALSADGKLLASAGQDQSVRLWEPRSGRLIATLRGHTGALWGVAVSRDGQLVASGGQDGTVRLWDAGTHSVLATLPHRSGGVWSVALSAGGEMIASGGGDGTVQLWEVAAGRLLANLRGHSGSVWGTALSADCRVLASGGGDGAVRLWEPAAGRAIATFQGHTSGVRAVSLTANGELVASGGQDGIVRLWEVGSGRLVRILEGHSGGLGGVALSADGQLVASCGGDRTVRLWDPRTARELAALNGCSGGVWSLALTLDGNLIASGDENGEVSLWEARSGRQMANLLGHTSAVAGLALSANGRVVAAGGADGTVSVWDTQTRQPIAILQGHTSAVWGMALDSEGRLLVSGSEDGTVRLWDIPTRQSVGCLTGHTNAVYGVTLAHQLLASGGADGSVRLWDTRTGRALAVLEGHTGVVRSVALSADGRVLASGGFDESVRLWDTGRQTCLRVLRPDRKYERVEITGVTGISDAQRRALTALGALDRACEVAEEGQLVHSV